MKPIGEEISRSTFFPVPHYYGQKKKNCFGGEKSSFWFQIHCGVAFAAAFFPSHFMLKDLQGRRSCSALKMGLDHSTPH